MAQTKTKSKTASTKSKAAPRKSTSRTSRVKTKVVHEETDGAFFLKMVMFLILSSIWLRIETSDGTVIPLPVGAVIAVFYALHDHFQIDRKIELALILVASLISFWLPIGIYVSL